MLADAHTNRSAESHDVMRGLDQRKLELDIVVAPRDCDKHNLWPFLIVIGPNIGEPGQWRKAELEGGEKSFRVEVAGACNVPASLQELVRGLSAITTPTQQWPLRIASEFEIGSNTVLFMASFDDKSVHNLFGATPGPKGSGARIDVPLEQVVAGLDQVFGCPAGLEEFAEGAGETIDDLASSFKASLFSFQIANPPFLEAILEFILLAADDADDPTTGLRAALFETEFVELVTRVLQTVAQSTPSGANHTVVVEIALKAGKNRGCALRDPPKPLNYRVVRGMEGVLPSTEDVIESRFATSQIWADFTVLAQKRIGIRRALSDCIACENMTCAVMSADISVFKRCICNNHYCSKVCQKADWRAGHRTVCHLFVAGVHRRDSAFIRAVVHHDYELLKADTIYPEQVRFMSQFPNDAFFIIFNYSHNRQVVPQIEVQSLERLESETKEAWFSLLSWAGSDEAPMELHVMKDDMGITVVPMRTNSSVVHDGMCSIAVSLPPSIIAQADSPALLAAVQAVLDTSYS
ncbi:hypothetical protein C8R43DRAFT_952891 [Mycena crocata]|nr:hypothetical protein C8R43DRAFT_952891 [Mycena crocata]